MNASQADYLMSLKEIEKLKAQRDALLGAMKLIQHATAPTHNDDAYHEAAHDISSAAIDAARSKNERSPRHHYAQ